MRKTIVTITGPTCSGKSTMAMSLAEKASWPEIISHTTRPIRVGETCGVNYHFVTEEEFAMMRINGEFVETNRHSGSMYGVSKAAIASALAESQVAVIVVDPNGKKALQEHVDWMTDVELFSIFVTNDRETLLERVLRRMFDQAIKDEQIDFAAFSKRIDFMMTRELRYISDTDYVAMIKRYDAGNRDAVDKFIIDRIADSSIGVMPPFYEDQDKAASGF